MATADKFNTSIRFPEEVYEETRRIAEALERSVNWYVVNAVKEANSRRASEL